MAGPKLSEAQAQTQQAIDHYVEGLKADKEYMRQVNLTPAQFKEERAESYRKLRKENKTFDYTDAEIEQMSSEATQPAHPDQVGKGMKEIAKGNEEKVLGLIQATQEEKQVFAKHFPNITPEKEENMIERIFHLEDGQHDKLPPELQEVFKIHKIKDVKQLDLAGALFQYDNKEGKIPKDAIFGLGSDLQKAAEAQGIRNFEAERGKAGRLPSEEEIKKFARGQEPLTEDALKKRPTGLPSAGGVVPEAPKGQRPAPQLRK